jgi:hypothetical protein
LKGDGDPSPGTPFAAWSVRPDSRDSADDHGTRRAGQLWEYIIFKVANVDTQLRKSMSKPDFHGCMAAAAESGEFDLPRREGSDHFTPVPDLMATNMTRVQSFVHTGGRCRNARYLLRDEIANKPVTRASLLGSGRFYGFTASSECPVPEFPLRRP